MRTHRKVEKRHEIGKIFLKLMNYNIFSVGNPTLLDLLKKYWKKIINYWLRMVNVDTINWEKLFDRTANHI